MLEWHFFNLNKKYCLLRNVQQDNAVLYSKKGTKKTFISSISNSLKLDLSANGSNLYTMNIVRDIMMTYDEKCLNRAV